ncbi:conserved hypothetical protein [Xenorhabdus bovienii str. puntauvense]|uniref:DUF3800 domain-containing protein n=1 Tax=Xenorhabdus bovienii str. puntauvense TaxID=1398201 RepID=A0A077NLQ5_XENBV|nr:DUF3800 domain-containing protein [Xenorhabdus bovienii]CDG99212.1 conserved hypothetical protein [Xenorhabdus bovienii str. puntauvense]
MMEFSIVKKEYVFVYDESNNSRLLRVENGGLNIDLDKTKNAKKQSPIFLLGGVVYYRNKKIDFESLKKELMLQSSVIEMKFKHIATGDLEQILKSSKLKIVLNWIINNDLFIHYFVVNIFNYAVADIIDDMYLFLNENGLTFYQVDDTMPCVGSDDVSIINNINYLKDALYWYIEIDKGNFVSLIEKFNFPHVEDGMASKFIRELYKLIRKKIDYFIKSGNVIYELNQAKSLLKVLKKCSGLSSLFFTKEDNPKILLKDFFGFYFNKLIIFKNSEHIFDEEKNVSIKLDRIAELFQGEISDNYKFLKSDHYPIQLSDVISGLIKNLFSYLCEKDEKEILSFKERMTKDQKECLNMLKKVMNESTEECSFFAYRIAIPRSVVNKYQLLIS